MIRALAVLRIAVLSLVVAPAASAQGGVLLQGLIDLEGWSTDSSSNLLTRNFGRPGSVVRGQLWSAIEPVRGLFVFGLGEVETGTAREFTKRYTSVELAQAGVRWARHRAVVVNAGRMFHPIGVFGPRTFSTRNPLIGTPDGYSPVYPVGLMASGEVGIFDYRAGAVTLPLTHEGYEPRPGAWPRPVAGFGVTPVTGFRIGGSASVGPYLNDEFSARQLAGRSWQSYYQSVIAGDVEFGVAHLDLRAEAATSKYEVPTAGSISGRTGYVEGRYTLTPRVFVAARGEVNDYPFVRATSDSTWVGRRTDFRNWEAGVGYRATASTLIKTTLRGDKWTVPPGGGGFIRPGGRAVAMQLSQSFDVIDWVDALRNR